MSNAKEDLMEILWRFDDKHASDWADKILNKHRAELSEEIKTGVPAVEQQKASRKSKDAFAAGMLTAAFCILPE